MDFFKDLFSFKRTRMIDEAVFFHKPVTLGKNILSFFVLMLISNLLVAVVQSIPLIFYLAGDLDAVIDAGSGSTEALEELLDNFPAWLSAVTILFNGFFAFIAIFYCKKYENRAPLTMGLHTRGCVPEYLIGFLIGGGMIGVSLLLNLAFGSVEVSYLSFSPVILLFLVAFIAQGFGESAFVQGYFTVSVARDYAPIVSISAGTVAFLLFRLEGTGATVVSYINVLLLGFLLGVYMFKRGSIMGTAAILAGWSFLNNAVFGTSDNGSSLFLTVADGSKYVNGGYSGVGGGLCATLVLVITTILLLLTKTKKSEVSDFEADSAKF